MIKQYEDELKAGDVVEHDKKDEEIRKLEEIEAEMEVS